MGRPKDVVPWPDRDRRPVTTRRLPMLDVLDVAPAAPSAPRSPAMPTDDRLAEYLPDVRALPRFHVWTLGCQMNRSDSEEMAGRLLASGCEESASMDDADLIVINTCAIREGAEQKVIGRQGQLARLKDANPGLRVVLTGCSVREPDRAGLRRRYPAVDLFLRPDEEPELVDRLGLASAQAPIGASGATTVVGRTVVGVADHLAGTRAAAVGQGSVARESPVSAWLPIIYGCDKTCTYCIVPFSRGPERSRPFDDIVAEARQLADAGYREVTLLGQNVNSYGHDLAPEPRFGHIDTDRWAGRQLDLEGRPDLAELIRAVDGLGIPRLRFVTSHPWDLSDRLIAAMADCPSVCEHLHLPVQSGDDAVLKRMGRQYTIEHYLERLAAIRRRSGHRHLDRHHRRVLRRDRSPVRVDAGPARDGPLRPGLRGGLLGPSGDAGDPPGRRRAGRGQEAPPQHAARAPGADRAGPQRGVDRARGGRAGRRRDAAAQPRARERGAVETARGPAHRPDPRAQADPPRRRSGARRTDRHRPRGPCRAVRVARHRRRGVTPPLIVLGGATATGKTGLAIEPGRSPHRRGPRRGDHLRRLAPGLPRPGYRDGQGHAGGSGTGRPPRPRPRRSGRGVHRRRLQRPRRGRAGVAGRP